jgi:DNA modification methylase
MEREMSLQILQGDALAVLKTMPDCSVQCCVTSPPYWGLRDYGCDGQIGLERTPEEYVARIVEVFREVRRVLRDDGTVWLNIGDSYCGGNTGNQSNVGQRYGDGKESNGHVFRRDGAFAASIGLKPKDLVGIPWRLAFALQSDGWWLRQDIIWHKPNPMPESVTDRCTKAHEYIFLMTKSAKYYYDAEAIKEPIKDSSIARLTQDVASQEGSDRVPGKTNGKMKAVRFGGNKLCPDTRLQSGNEWNPAPEGTVANKRSVWTVPTASFSEAHFATFPPDLIKPCIMAGSKPGDTILDPFGGSGTTGMVALELGRKAMLIELNSEYVKLAERRCDVTQGLALA